VKTRMLRVLKMSSIAVLAALLVDGSLTTVAAGQTSSSAGPAISSAVPRLVKFSGVVKDEQGRPQSGVEGLTFALYKDQSGGAPLWLETQNVQADSSGRYTVFLGASKPEGLPVELFASGDARWLAVQPSEQAEQPRVLLVSTPYALKAADAETLGGLPASAFALAAPANSNGANTTTAVPDATAASAPPPASTVTGSGTANFVPLWTSTSNIGNSVVFQSGSGSTAKVGIGTTTPSSTLDVKGSATLEGLVTIPPISGANATRGESSQGVAFVASSYDSSTRAPLSQTYEWKAEPINNNTSNPSGTLNLLFGAGTSTPTETGLKLSNKGIYTFAAGQTFPGTGTITGVTTGSGSGLTGGGTTGNLALSLTSTCSNGQVLQWNGTAWVCVSAGVGTITGVTAGTDLTGGGTTNSVTLNLDVTKTDARYPQLNTANTFTGNQSVTGNFAATGTVSGQQLISSLATAPPMVVSSTLQVANLNASLLGGQPASSFPQLTAASNTFAGGITASSFTGNGSSLTNVNAALLGGFPPGAFTSTGANTFSATQTIASGDFALYSGNVYLPNTTGPSGGVILMGGATFIHECCPNSAYNTFVGAATGTFTADASASNGGTGGNTAVGSNTLAYLTSGYNNAANGAFALDLNTTGYNNTADGAFALFANTTGNDNTANGFEALKFNGTGSDNTAEGYKALHSNTTGIENTASGNLALYSNTTGYDNIASGGFALYQNTTGYGNIAIGVSAGYSLQTGIYNLLLGAGAGSSYLSNESDNIDIGSPGVAGDFGVTRIGSNGSATYIDGIRAVTTGKNDAIQVLIDSNGQLGTASSSRRYKEDIHDMGDASDGLLRLRPVTFHYKKPYADGSKPIQYGLIAEEVADVYPDLVVRGKDGQIETVQYYKLDAMLLNEVQRQAKARAADRIEIEELKLQTAEQQKQIMARKQACDDERSELAQLRAEVERLAGMVRTSNATVVQARAPAPRTR
jgi:hypothetical protein